MGKEMQKHGEFCWNELMTSDTKKAKEFYSSLLGWEFVEHEIEGKKYSIIKAAGKESGGVMEIPSDKAGQIPPHWITYVNVKDLEESVEKAKTLGASIKVPPTKVSDFGSFAILTDPTGAHFALWESSCESCD